MVRPKHRWGIFLLSFSSLLFELSLTRVFSVTLWYHFGFLIISTALLGFGVAGVLLSVWRRLRDDYDVDSTLGRLSLLCCFSIVAGFWLLQRIPFDPFSLYTDRWQLLYMPLTYLAVATPFFFAGLALSLLFTRYPLHVNSLYAYDLAGAALGCLAIVCSIAWLGGGGSALLAAVFAALAAFLFFGVASPGQRATALGLAVLSLLLSLNATQVIGLRITANKRGVDEARPVFSEWNTFSKIDLFVDSSEVVPGKLAPAFVFDEGTAATGLDFDLRPDVRSVLEHYKGDTLYPSCLAYLGKHKPSVLVIGSGGGSEVLDALHYGAGRVVAVEINPIINRTVSNNDLWGNLLHQPEVHLVTDEARNYVRASHDRFDAIVAVHTISNAAIASGALSLSENYVLTKEAFEDYYDHLTDSGIIYFTRPEFQLPRLFATGREMLDSRGIPDAGKHFLAYSFPVGKRFSGRKAFYSVVVMSKAVLGPAQVDRMKRFICTLKDNNVHPFFLYDPVERYSNIYDSVLKTARPETLYAGYPYEIAPATDDQPYFNHHVRWSSIGWQSFRDIFSQDRMGRMALEDKPVAEVSLLLLLLQVMIIAALAILLPLWRYSSGIGQMKKVAPYLLYFAGLGFGFITIEMVVIQEFGLLLGEPVYTFAIVLAALLLSTGAGAWLSGKYGRDARKTMRHAILLLGLLVLAASFCLPAILRGAAALPLAARMGLAVLLILPIGMAAGMPFPSGIRVIGSERPSLIAWAWGVNGFFTVIGSVVALLLSMAIGFQAVLWVAVGVYGISLTVMQKNKPL